LSTSSTEQGGSGSAALLQIGRIVRPHGLSGEVIVGLVTNRPGRLDRGSVLYTGTEDAPSGGELRVISATSHQHRFIVQFEGIVGREAAESLRGTVLFAAAVADDDAYFVHELIGCELFDQDGNDHGLVASVQQNPASDLLVGERGWLVPLRFVVEREPGRIVVDVPPGMFE
jgi:16S rRNA processing protein RimM